MNVEQRFNNFYTALQESNPIWWDGLPLVFPNKDIKEAVKKSWITLHAEGKLKSNIDWKECRNLVNKTLTWQEQKNSEGFEKAKPVEIHPDALTGEARETKIKEFLEVLAKVGQPEKVHGSRVFHVAQQIQSKGGKYTPPPDEYAEQREKHLEWVRCCFDPKTGKPNENWIPENEWLKQLED